MGGLISALCKLHYTSIGTPLNLENLNKKLVSDPTHTLIWEHLFVHNIITLMCPAIRAFTIIGTHMHLCGSIYEFYS